jgi:hypothetical protein
MKRRGFLGFLGGAAVAGPAAAKNAIAEALPISKGNSSLMSSIAVNQSYDFPPGIGSSAGGVFSAMDRIAKLRRMISGEETREPDPYEHEQRQRIIAENSISTLRSVSVPVKLQMLARASDRIVAERQKKYWMQELKELMSGERP